jgi:hypothetical protein
VQFSFVYLICVGAAGFVNAFVLACFFSEQVWGGGIAMFFKVGGRAGVNKWF